MADIQLLTDEDILDYTRDPECDHVITNHYDFPLNTNVLKPTPGGLYDSAIFGSPYPDHCFCNKINPRSRLRSSKEPCPNCGARVYSKEDALRRFARIELPFYYLNDLRFDIFLDLFYKIFKDTEIKYDFVSDMVSSGYTVSKNSKRIGIKVFDSCQFNYDPKKNILTISEYITNESKCSYEGLMKIINENFPGFLGDFQKLVNRYYIVMPSVMRPVQHSLRGGSSVLGVYKLTNWYQMIVRLCCVTDTNANPTNYNATMETLKTPGEKVRYRAALKAFINSGKKIATNLLNTSKKNLAREIYSVRTKNSARCPIIPSTTLSIDEVGVPTQIAYEMCREGFIKYLQEELNFTEQEAKESTKNEALNPKTQELFKKYAEKQIVLEI